MCAKTLPQMALCFILGAFGCSRGKDEPTSIEVEPPNAKIHASELPEDILNKVIAAYGGKEKMTRWNVGKIKYASRMVGAPPGDVTIEDTFQLPGYSKRVTQSRIDGKVMTMVWVVRNGVGWQKRGDQESVAIENDTTKRRRHTLGDFADLSDLQDGSTKVTVMGEKEVNGKPAVAMKCKSDDGEVLAYFDKATAFLVKSEKRGPHPLTGKEVFLETYLTNYKEVQGGQVPLRIKGYGDGEPILDITILDIEFLDKIDLNEFVRP